MTRMVNSPLIKPFRHSMVTAERVRMLFQQSPVAYLATLFAGAVLAVVLSPYEDVDVLLAWYFLLVLGVVVRALITYRYHKISPPVEDAWRWEVYAMAGAALSGGIWSTSLFVFDAGGHPNLQIFILITLIGMTGGAVSIYASSMKVFLSFSLPVLLAVSARFWLDANEFYSGMLLLTTVYSAATFTMSRYYSRQIDEVLRLKEANEGLHKEMSTRAELEMELRETNRKFQDFAESAADFFWELDAELNITLITSNAKEIFGSEIETLGGCPWHELVALEPGCERYLSVEASLKNHVSLSEVEFVWVTEEGMHVNVQLDARPVFKENGEFAGYRGVGRDITERVKLLQRLTHQANHDLLTGLLNRRAFMQQLEDYIEQVRGGGGGGVLCYFDLDHFKAVNDLEGHLVGDELIKQIAALLEQNIRASDTLARFGGDEFVILFRNVSLHGSMQMSDRLLALLRDYHFSWGENDFFIGASFGLTQITQKTHGSMALLAEANMACTTAKGKGRNRIEVYNPGEQEQAVRLAGLGHVTELRQALQEKRLRLLFQPIVALSNPELEPHMEVLLGLANGDSVELCGRRIQAAEHYGLMPEVDRWVIRETFHCYQKNGGDAFPVLGINLSGSSLGDRKLFDYIEHQLRVTGIPARKVCFEITETAAIHNMKETQKLIKKLKAIGCRFALDDFGSGLSNFSYLKYLDVDYLKIDGSFVRNIASNHVDRAMVSAMTKLAKELGMLSVGEFVESAESLQMLKELGVDYGQGYKLGRPSHQLEKVLQQCRQHHGKTEAFGEAVVLA